MHIWKPSETLDDLLESQIDNVEGNSGARSREKKTKIEGFFGGLVANFICTGDQ